MGKNSPRNKFKWDLTNCQDHRQDCSFLSNSTWLVHKPAYQAVHASPTRVTLPQKHWAIVDPSAMAGNRKRSKALNKVTRCNTMMGKDSFLGSLLVLPAELYKGIVG